jgi:type VI secretion system lysozyme-like protein
MALFSKFTYSSSGSRARPDHEDLLSIVENLNNILNTKKDYGSFLADFGIRDMNEYTSRDDIVHAVMDEVKHNIEQFESRVRVIDIQIVDDENPLMLSFKVECIVQDSSKSLNMVFDSVFNSFSIKN